MTRQGKSAQKKVAGKPSAGAAARVSPGKVQRPSVGPGQTRVPQRTASETLSGVTRGVLNGIGAGIYLAQKGRFVWVNPLFEKLTGFKAAELIGGTLLDHVHPEDREKTKKNAIRSLKKNSLDTYVYRFIKKNSEMVRFLETVNPYEYEGSRATLGTVMDISRHHSIQESLFLSEDRYGRVLDEIDEGYVELDLAGNFTFVSEAAARIIGYTPSELIGTNFRDKVDEETAKKLLFFYEQLFKTGERVKGLEVPFLSKNGPKKFVEVSGTLIMNPEGRPVGFRGLARDVTERRWTEEALLQSEARYFSIIESIGEAYFETDLRGLTTFVNDKVCEKLGYSRNEMLNLSYRDLQDAENADKTFKKFHEIFTFGQPCHAYQYDAVQKDGSRVVFEMSISLMRDAEGNPIGFRGLSRDITERKRMEEALRASEERSRTIIETIPDPYFENDLNGQFVYANAAYANLLGAPPEEIQKTSFRDLLNKEDADKIVMLYKTVYKTGMTIKNVEMEARTKQGEKRSINLSVGLIRDHQGNPSGFHGIIRDVTEKKKAQALIVESERMLREYSESLEHRIQERTADLEKAKMAAEAASRVKSDFLANISHEFQTPLNSIIGFTKVLKDRLFGELNDKQEEFIRYISAAGETLSKLLTEIIDVSNLSSGRAKIELSQVSIIQVLSRTTTLLAGQIAAKNQLMKVEVALDADVSIEADDEKIRHIFFHLLSNAVKYTPDGGNITVTAQRTLDYGGRDGVAVVVADTGIGIRNEDLPRLFQNFGRLESAYSRETSGIGVGLALTKILVELHGGGIRVESEFGRGSRFIVFLPLKQKPGSTAE
jgi:PAS domain S-box-containing protein